MAQGALAAQARDETPKHHGRSGSATVPRPARISAAVAASSAGIAGRGNTEHAQKGPVYPPTTRRKRQQVQSFKPDVWDGFAKFGTRLDERVRY